ncbi:MAG: hypothetical protein AABX71_01535, partial [Nanoarchaeota archaeon]
SIFGNDLISSTRGQLEATGSGIKLTRGDLALRVNFATVDSLKEGNIIDRRAGRTLTTSEAEILAKALNRIKLPVDFIFKQTIQHRAVLVFRGGLSEDITGNDSGYYQGRHIIINKLGYSKPLDDEENSQYAANILNEFLGKAYQVLDRHPINEQRRKRGLLPANCLLVRGPGIEIPNLRIYKRWIAVTPMPLEIGLSKLSGMKVFDFGYPELKGLDAYQNLYEGLKKTCNHAIKVLKKNSKSANYAVIYLKETDLPGHDNKPLEKKAMIEYIDKTLFKFLRGFAPKKKIKIVVTADHSTPCKLKRHSSDPVPVLFYNNSVPREKKFSEKEAAKGTLGSFSGKELLEKVGFTK